VQTKVVKIIKRIQERSLKSFPPELFLDGFTGTSIFNITKSNTKTGQKYFAGATEIAAGCKKRCANLK